MLFLKIVEKIEYFWKEQAKKIDYFRLLFSARDDHGQYLAQRLKSRHSEKISNKALVG